MKGEAAGRGDRKRKFSRGAVQRRKRRCRGCERLKGAVCGLLGEGGTGKNRVIGYSRRGVKPG